MNDNEMTLLIILVILLVVPYSFGMMGFGMMNNFGYGFGGMGIFSGLIMIGFTVAIILAILWILKQLKGGNK